LNDKLTIEGEAASEPSETTDKHTKDASPQETLSDPIQENARADKLIVGGAWLIALSMVFLVIHLAYQLNSPSAAANAQDIQIVHTSTPTLTVKVNAPANAPVVDLPDFQPALAVESVNRQINLHTVMATRPRLEVVTYTVVAGDSVFGIATQFNIKPETVLWANYALLNDSPHNITIGMELNIPPVNGVYYEWKEEDTLDSVANRFKSKPEDIINWPGNDIDIVEPEVEPGQMILVPGGSREFVQWFVPTIPRGQAGVSRSVYGPGACEGNYSGAFGTGGFIWPSANRRLSGNDYWSGHLGIDIAAGMGDNIYAADGGVIVFSGWAYYGYGNMIMIDHGNGYQTVYAHLSSVTARCGQSVSQGQYIAAAGSTGNSTGAHLHFEVRYMGGFINPWFVLP
jgi:murein DD-endopeptidase MepM/ murein hydrolase activator NlpD